ncbi:DNA packaging protein [Lactobacillus sakei] [Lactiplantibacillus mudanjiangensis]|uniref:head-tail connector protein n=1 Tax=Lactiplantibacillus mudanjiangensis TaxID=1296538 RepID=UPI001014F44C|nr:DNA packaging protein [Lactobacillus sakei] [Lactiplantibacillus mudanjiangensis]
MELSAMKLALHIDWDEEDSLITGFMKTAEMMIKSGIGDDAKFYDDSRYCDAYNTALIMLTDHLNKTRSATTELNLHEVPLGVQTIMLKLKPAYRLYERGEQDESN